MEMIGDIEGLRAFVAQHLGDDAPRLRLRYAGKQTGYDIDFAVTQIESRRLLRDKLDERIAAEQFLVPAKAAVEQASAREVAKWHASLLPKDCFVIDLTAGMGSDAISFCLDGHRVAACELDPLRAAVLRENKKTLSLDNLEIIEGDSIDLLRKTDRRWDVAFIDPARRDSSGNRKYALADCEPDIVKALPVILSKTGRVLIKVSPMLDVTELLRQLPEASAVYAVSLDGECKELLVEVSSEKAPVALKAIAIKKGERQEYVSDNGGKEPLAYPTGDWKWLYEPDAALMKLGDFQGIAARWQGLRKAAPGTHLYLSEEPVDGFIGRRWRIRDFDIAKPQLKALKGERMMVATRNHPLSATEARKKLGLREGDRAMLYGFRYAQDGAKERPIWVIGERDEEGR